MATPREADLTEVRVDRYLFAIRLLKTRSLATQVCRGGHVRINGVGAKASHGVRQGDEIALSHDNSSRVIEVIRPIDRRVSASEATASYIDHSPPVEKTDRSVTPFLREPSSGRPTKRDRRKLDRLRRNA